MWGGPAALLASLGFRQSGESWKERVFTPIDASAAADLGEHAANSLKIELHERICERLPLRLTDISEIVYPAEPRPGLNCYPSRGALMLHLLLHAAGSMAFQCLRILQLHDIALLARLMADADWNVIIGPNSSARLWWAYPPLELASRYYRASVPARVLAALKSNCPYILRAVGTHKSLVEVSYSYLWIKAFPGIEWSHSLGEMLAYTLGRVRPNATHLALRESQAASQVWAKQGDWSRACRRLGALCAGCLRGRRAQRPCTSYLRLWSTMTDVQEPQATLREGLLGDTVARDYAGKLSKFNAFARPELHALIKSLNLTPGMHVLDVGCGTGEALNWLLSEVTLSGRVVGVDLSAAHVAAAKLHAAPTIRILQANLCDDLFDPASFDLVWCVNTINHLTDPVGGVVHLATLLRTGGRIAIGQSSLLPDMYFAWDSRLERVVNDAVRRYYQDRYDLDEHDLKAVRAVVGILRQAALQKITVRTVMIERTFPLDAASESYLGESIFHGTWGERLRPYLSTVDYDELAGLCDSEHANYALRRPDFHFLQTFTLAIGEV